MAPGEEAVKITRLYSLTVKVKITSEGGGKFRERVDGDAKNVTD